MRSVTIEADYFRYCDIHTL